MIKKASIWILVILLFALTACSAQPNEGKNPAASASTQVTASVEPSIIPTETAKASPSAKASITAEEQSIIDTFVNEPASDFTLEKADGTKVTLSSLKGKPVVLNFWATWCPYCVEEFPYFTQAQKDFPQIQFFAIDTGERSDLNDKKNRSANEKFARSKGFDLPILFDVDSKLFSGKYASQGLPTTYMIDSKGNVRLYFAGAAQDYDSLKTYLNAFVKADT